MLALLLYFYCSYCFLCCSSCCCGCCFYFALIVAGVAVVVAAAVTSVLAFTSFATAVATVIVAAITTFSLLLIGWIPPFFSTLSTLSFLPPGVLLAGVLPHRRRQRWQRGHIPPGRLSGGLLRMALGLLRHRDPLHPVGRSMVRSRARPPSETPQDIREGEGQAGEMVKHNYFQKFCCSMSGNEVSERRNSFIVFSGVWPPRVRRSPPRVPHPLAQNRDLPAGVGSDGGARRLQLGELPAQLDDAHVPQRRTKVRWNIFWH